MRRATGIAAALTLAAGAALFAAGAGLTPVHDAKALEVKGAEMVSVNFPSPDLAVREFIAGKERKTQALFLGPGSKVKKTMDLRTGAEPVFSADGSRLVVTAPLRRGGPDVAAALTCDGKELGKFAAPDGREAVAVFAKTFVFMDINVQPPQGGKRLSFHAANGSVLRTAGDAHLGLHAILARAPGGLLVDGTKDEAQVVQAYGADGTLLWTYEKGWDFDPDETDPDEADADQPGADKMDSGVSCAADLSHVALYRTVKNEYGKMSVEANVLDKAGVVCGTFTAEDLTKVCVAGDRVVVFGKGSACAYDFEGKQLWEKKTAKPRVVTDARLLADGKRAAALIRSTDGLAIELWTLADGTLVDGPALALDRPGEARLVEKTPGELFILVAGRGVWTAKVAGP